MILIRSLMAIRGAFAALIALIVGAGLLFAGNYIRQSTAKEIQLLRSAQGVVVDIETVRSKRSNSDSYKVVIEYRPENSDPVQFRPGFSGAQSLLPKKGDTVEVLYDPANPEAARLNSFLDLWMAPTILMGMGGIFALLGFGGLLRALKAALKLLAAGAVIAAARR